MKYLFLVCVEEPFEADPADIDSTAWVDEMDRRGARLLGNRVADPRDATTVRVRGGEVLLTDGPYVETKEWLGGFAVVDVPDDEAAKVWGGKIAEACGWPHEIRRFKPQPRAE